MTRVWPGFACGGFGCCIVALAATGTFSWAKDHKGLAYTGNHRLRVCVRKHSLRGARVLTLRLQRLASNSELSRTKGIRLSN